jgi:DNA-directed RNA polymerase subunit RPC12/RpoP
MNAATMTCPNCNSKDIRARPKQRSLDPSGPVAIFGLVFAMLHQLSEANVFHCAACEHEFQRRTTAARIACALLAFFCAVFALRIIAVVIAFAIDRGR